MPLSREQFDSTMATYEPRLRAHVLGQVGASQGLDVQEIIQEVRIRLWRVLSSEKVVEHLASYLRKTVMSVVIDSVRRNQALREDAIDDLLEHQLPAERHSVAPDKVVDSQHARRFWPCPPVAVCQRSCYCRVSTRRRLDRCWD